MNQDIEMNLNFNESDEDIRRDELKAFLQHYKLEQYYQTFINEGFDRLLSLFDVTESDLISLHVKRGHRRLLQRAIATCRGVPTSTPILINYGYDEPVISHKPKPGTNGRTTTTSSSQSSTTRGGGYYNTRKKRHQYVPQKPVTAFDEYLAAVKSELSSSSSEVYSIAYNRWNQLSVSEKETYERKALHANSDYVMGE